jgi:hypothetical protein
MRFIFQSLLLLLITQSTSGFMNSKNAKINGMKNFNSTVVDTSDTKIQNVLSEEQIQTFQEDGVLLVRQLVSGKELARAMDEVAEMSKKQSPYSGAYKNIEFQTWSTNDALKDIAFFSKVPKVNDLFIQNLPMIIM